MGASNSPAGLEPHSLSEPPARHTGNRDWCSRMTPNIPRSHRKQRGPSSPSSGSEGAADAGGCALKRLDEELMGLVKMCEGFSVEEMRRICAPLLAAHRKAQARRMLGYALIATLILAILYGLCQLETVTLYLTAIGRILMIKALPLWDWTPLFYNRCLMDNPYYEPPTITEADCVACESLEGVERIREVSYQHLLDGYLLRDAPLIVQDAMESWPAMAAERHFWVDNITQLYLQEDKLRDTVPCVLSSNLRASSSDLAALLKKIQNPELDRWFVHWHNCELSAVKVLREFYQRPYFLANSVSPAHYNWILMSADYNTKIYKKLDVDPGLVQMMQFRGSSSIRLSPHPNCNLTCSQLQAELVEGEILVFPSWLWRIEYLPGRGSDNLAILTETDWNDLNFN